MLPVLGSHALHVGWEACAWSHWQQQRFLVWSGLHWSPKGHHHPFSGTTGPNTPLVFRSALGRIFTWWRHWSFPQTTKKRTRERWKGKIHYVVAFLTAWGKETWILPFYSFSAWVHSGFLGKKNASSGVKWCDLLEEVLLQWLTAQGASGWLFTSDRRRNAMDLNVFLWEKQCTHINLSYTGKLRHTSPSVLCGNNMYSNMGIWACKFCVLWPPRTK